MRKVLSFFVLAGVLLASSCSLKEDFRGNDSDFATLSFTVGEPGVSATRAIGDGTSVDALYYAVYDDKGNFIADLAGNKVGTTFPTTVEITLAKGQTYKIAFWAQDKDCGAYSFGQYGDIKNIYIDYAGLNNDESRDAFFKTIDHKVVGDIALDVTLERPFAQINLGVTQEDWDNAAKAGIYVAQSKLVINNAATELNLFNGQVNRITPLTYDFANIPTQTLEVDYNKDGVKEAYKYLSLSYILVADQGQTANEEGMFGAESALVNATFSLETNKAPFEVKVDNLPVQRNWRTNVIGEVLTGDIKFNIDVDPIFDGEEIYPDTLEEELYFAALNGGEVALTSDIALTYPMNVNGDMVLNMGGYTLTGSILVAEGANLVVNEGTIVNNDATVSGIESQGDLTLNEVNISSARHAVRIEKGNVVINGGEYTIIPKQGKTQHALNVSGNSNVVVKDGKFVGPKGTNNDSGSAVNVQKGATVTIEGGDFSKGKNKTLANAGTLKVQGGTFDQDPNQFLVEGYKTIEKGGKYYVVENDVDAVAGNTEDLQTSLSNGQYVVLTDDIAVGRTEAGSNGYGATGISQLNGGVIDGNGNDISVNAWGTWDSAINTTGGTIKNLNVTGGMRGIFVNHNSSYSDKVILENVTIDGTVYTISCDQGTNKGLEAYNSTFNGWTSYAATIGNVKFIDCSFGEGQGYSYCRPYASTEFVNCAFEAGYQLDARAKVTFENCTIGGVALTADNLSTLVTSNIANASVK